MAVSVPAKPPVKPPAKPKPAVTGPTFEKDVLPMMNKHCISCHSGKTPSADLSLTGLNKASTVLAQRKIWEKVVANVEASHMPPPGMPAPTRAERDRLVLYFQSIFSKADCQLNDPGRVTLRRLNRAEYNNTVRDLLHVTIKPADEFPSDDVGYGFDNIGDVLSLSPLLMEKYLTASAKSVRAAIRTPEDISTVAKWEGTKLAGAGGTDPPAGGDGRSLFAAGEVGVDYTFPMAGKYKLKAKAWASQAGPDLARMSFRFNGADVRTVDVTASKVRDAVVYEVTVDVSPAGTGRFAVAFINDYYDQTSPDMKMRGDRNLYIEGLEIEGPLGVPKAKLAAGAPVSESQKRLFAPGNGAKDENERAKRIVSAFARRAFRRPVTEAEVTRLAGIVATVCKGGGSFERGVQLAFQAALVSPNFLFRVEADTGKTRPLTNMELATRLSYFLWSSMPDDTLLSLAENGKLSDPKVLKAQARRMLADPKSRALTENFAGQWLQLRKLDRVTPDSKQFPDFNDTLRAAMKRETEMYFDEIVREDRSVLEFLDSDWTFLNERLARHYGNTQIMGDGFRKVTLVGGRRGGVLTQASVLTLTSNPTRTSPVKRGKWVLDNLLNTPPPPAPPGVGELPDDAKKEAVTGTLRQRMEQHRKNPACASCHQRMDPIGFGLENFDAVGAWRLKDGTDTVDASGTLPDGKTFRGPKQLRTILMSKKELFVRALAEKLLTYAIGRGIENTDRCHIDTIATETAHGKNRFSALVEAIVVSDPFLKRRSDPVMPVIPTPAKSAPVKKAQVGTHGKVGG